MVANPLTLGRHALLGTMTTQAVRALKRTSPEAVVRQAATLELIKRKEVGRGATR